MPVWRHSHYITRECLLDEAVPTFVHPMVAYKHDPAIAMSFGFIVTGG